MTPIDIKLYKLLARKDLTFGCLLKGNCHADGKKIEGKFIEKYGQNYGIQNSEFPFRSLMNSSNVEILGHTPELHDLHKWLDNSKYSGSWNQLNGILYLDVEKYIIYNSSKKLIDQSEETKEAIVNLIESCINTDY